MVNFIKKYGVFLLLLIVVGIVAFSPNLKSKMANIFSPTAEVQNFSHLSAQDYDISLRGINVPSTNLKNFKGKNLFLNFWGTWCPPCREEWPSIQKLYEAQNQNMDFVLIAMQDKEEDIIPYLKKNKFDVPVYIAESPIPETVLPKVFPTTFIINEKGDIIKKETAMYAWNSKEVEALIKNVTK